MIYCLGLPEIGGLSNLISHTNVINKISIIPDFSTRCMGTCVIGSISCAMVGSYYPGAEPGGGGYIAQRMFSAKDESYKWSNVSFCLLIMPYDLGHGFDCVVLINCFSRTERYTI